MRLSDAKGGLRSAGELLMDLVEKITGRRPDDDSSWIKCRHRSGSGFAWIRLIGDRARTYPAHSLHVVVNAHAELDTDDRFGRGQDWWGKDDRHVVAPAGDRTVNLHAALHVGRAT